MSSDASTPDDPFSLSALDEETELRALSRTLQLSDGFALIFARCNQPQQRNRLIGSLVTGSPPIGALEINFNVPITNLLDEVRGQIADEPSPEAVFVSGLENSLPSADKAHLTPVVANLNAARNSFPIVIQRPLVLWVPDYVLTAIARGAPDFFSIRSGIYYFAATPDETVGIASSLTGGDGTRAQSLSLAEKQERIKAIETLLSDYEALPSSQRDRRTEARLHTRLGLIFSSLGDSDEALEHFTNASRLAKQLGDIDLEAQALHGAGITYYNQARLNEAEEAFEHALRLSREIGSRNDEGVGLNSLGNVYELQGRLPDAEKAFQESLAIHREIGDRIDQAFPLHNLGRVYAGQNRSEEAENAFKEALEILRSAGDRNSEASILFSLGNLYESQGRPTEAQAALEQGIQIAHEVGNRRIEGGILAYLSSVFAARGNLDAARDMGNQALAILETTDSGPLLSFAQETLADIERRAAAQTELAEQQK